MGQELVKELFFENPSKEFYLRQIAKLTKVPKTSVARILLGLIQDKLVIRKSSEPFDRYLANSEDSLYVFYKKQFILEKIHKSGLIDYLAEETHPKAIILFGSCAKGEYNTGSDIDIFVNSPETDLDLKRFKLKHDINIIFASKLEDLNEDLRSNILNGIKLYGFIAL